MHTTITTTITTRINLDTLEPDHSVSIEAEDALPEQVIYAAVIGACKATLNSLPGGTNGAPDDVVDPEAGS